MSRRDTRGGDLPLIAWGEELRRRQLIRRRHVRRWTGLIAPLIGVVLGSIALPARPRLVWNASASAPIGLYAVTPGATPRRGDFVIARVPAGVRSLAASRRYIPINVPLVKHVGGVSGDMICAAGMVVTIDGKPAAVRRATDGKGRPMPWWGGCKKVGPGEVFLLSPAAPASFDGRYFGVSAGAEIIGTARLIWAR